MSKKIFVIFMPLEFLAALIAAALLFSDVGAIIYPIAAAVFCAVLAPFFIRLKKEQDETKKKKIRRNIVLILLLPILAAFAAIALVVIALMLIPY